jgi:hypothetical protein
MLRMLLLPVALEHDGGMQNETVDGLVFAVKYPGTACTKHSSSVA